ncbi:MAG: thioredoxin domain-containing protein [Verrucomicrobia bacterium]|nr:thioredoxin domain-containing protein [Verrucomicrobiota bacterium]
MSNRLANSKSPYLLQHAHNPVNWFEWGDEAFAEARGEDKPIFLSVGYSTCHWCHVMAHESFEDQDTAAVMNREFVNIKIDREERPDIDRVYMTFVQATTGHGGWPMSVWLTPELKPFFGGTYFPPEDRYGHPAFRRVLQQLANAWKEEREKIIAHGEHIMSALREASTAAEPTGQLPPAVFQEAYEQFAGSFDSREGGFGRAPKFPRPVTLNFLTRFYARHKHEDAGEYALEMVLLTLRKMGAGGIHDHLGGGFHRYSVDAFWHVPHFEKMLYDQAQLANAYLDAFQITGEHEFAAIVRDILDYVRRDMTSPGGGFFSAEDADSVPEYGTTAHAEGAFYVWTKRQIQDVLSSDADLFCFHFGIEENGNAPADADPHGEFTGKNILIQRHSVDETAKHFGKTPDEVRASLLYSREKLLQARSLRPRPHLDDKVIAAWNGLMISAFARAARVFGDGSYLETAARAAEFVRAKLWDASRKILARTFREGQGGDAFADDYAFVICGLLDLYEASFDLRWLKFARELQQSLDSSFWDERAGGYFSVTGNDASVLLRMKDDNDSAEPAASSVAALNLARLGAMLNDPEMIERARKTIAAFALQLSRFPTALPQMLVAHDFVENGATQIVIAADRRDESVEEFLREITSRFLPHAVTLLLVKHEAREFFGNKNEAVLAMRAIDSKPAAYVCRDFTCQAPVTRAEELRHLLSS